MDPVLVTVPNVPILATGIEYPLSTGFTTFTPDDLRSVVASQDDPAIASPRLKLSRGAVHDPNGYNEPAFGKVVNLRLGDNDQVIYGDYVGVPKWLADVLPVAYPNRSIEGNWDVHTATGKKWQLVVTAVELLGVHWPGVSTLEDLPLYYGDSMPEDVELAAAITAALSTGGDPMGEEVNAAVNVDDVRREFYDTLEATQMWWWIRAIQLEPNELIVDDDDGSLFRVPFDISGEEISFGDPVEVKIEYIDVAASASKQEKTAATAYIAAGLLAGRKPDVVYASRADSRPVNASQEGGEVDFEALRTRLGLPDTATEADVLAEVDRLRTAGQESDPAAGSGNNPMPEQDPNQQPGADAEPVTQQEPGGPGQPAPAPETPADVEASTVTIDRATFEELRRGAQAGIRAEQRTIDEEDERILAGAIKEGKFPPARKAHYKQALAADREGTLDLIKKLSPGIVPTELRQVAAGQGGGNTTHGDGAGEGLPQEWFPETARIRAEAEQNVGRKGDGVVLQAREG